VGGKKDEDLTLKFGHGKSLGRSEGGLQRKSGHGGAQNSKTGGLFPERPL